MYVTVTIVSADGLLRVLLSNVPDTGIQLISAEERIVLSFFIGARTQVGCFFNIYSLEGGLYMSEQKMSIRRFTFTFSILSFCAGFSGLICAISGAIAAQQGLLAGGIPLGGLACALALSAANGIVLRGRELGIYGVTISQKKISIVKLLTVLGAIFGILAVTAYFLF